MHPSVRCSSYTRFVAHVFVHELPLAEFLQIWQFALQLRSAVGTLVGA